MISKKISEKFTALAIGATLALSSAFATPAMAVNPLTIHKDNVEEATSAAFAMREAGIFPFVMIGGNKELRDTAYEVAEHVGKQVPIGYVIVPDIDGEERHMVVKNISKDGTACITSGFNGRLDSFKQVLKQSVSQAYSKSCASLVAAIN